MRQIRRGRVIILSFCLLFFIPGIAFAHNDTSAGPMIKDAKTALAKRDITYVLKWVKPGDEKKMDGDFRKAVLQNLKSITLRERVERKFFKRFLRLHHKTENVVSDEIMPTEETYRAKVHNALEKEDMTELFILVRPQDSKKLCVDFARALVGKQQSLAAKEYGETRFFKRLIWLHRKSQGELCSHMKPVNAVPEPAIALADQALCSGTIDPLLKLLAEKMNANVRRRFVEALIKKEQADESIDAGREYVIAYVAFIHYVESLYGLIKKDSNQGGKEETVKKEEENNGQKN